MGDFKDSLLWRSAFEFRADDPYSDERKRLEAAYLQMREQVRPVAADIALSVPGYTDHSLAHCDALWETASLAMGESVRLNPAEIFVLGCAFLVHDLGMGLSAHSGGLSGLISSTEWADHLYGSGVPAPAAIQATLEDDVARNPTWDGITSPLAKNVLTTYLRRLHASQAEKVMSESWAMTDKSEFYLLGDAALRRFYGQTIGRIAKSHWTDVSELPEVLATDMGAAADVPDEWRVNPLQLGCILRIADAIHIDARRAHPLHTPHRDPQGASRDHWVFQEKLLKPIVKAQRIVFTSSEAFPPEQSEAWWLAYDTVRMIDSELRRTDNLCSDLRLQRLCVAGAAGAESPGRFAAFVEPVRWEPVDARPFIGDQNLVMRQLGGRSLYGTHMQQRVAFREILANAMDASRALMHAFPGQQASAIEVSVDRQPDGDVLRIRDHGIGMLRNEIVGKLCNFGTSGWRSSSMSATLPGMLSSDFSPTGRFGIGFFAVFMVANEVNVTTRHITGGMADTIQLSFRGGIETRPILRSAGREEQLFSPGTVVEVKLNNRIDGDDGLLRGDDARAQFNADSLANFVKFFALTSDVDIATGIRPDATQLTVAGNSWLTLLPEDLFDALNPSVDRDRHEYETARAAFGAKLADVFDEEGGVAARMGLPSADLESSWLRRRSFYCGGLLSEGSWPFFDGVAIGDPVSASRDRVLLRLSNSNVREWFEKQIEMRGDVKAPLPLAHAIGAPISALPIALSQEGWVTGEGVMKWAESRNEVRLVQGMPRLVSFDGKYLAVVQDDDDFEFALIPDGYLAFNDHFIEENSSVRAFDYLDIPEAQRDLADAAELIRWWRFVHLSPLGDVLRCVAAGWVLPLWAVGLAAQFDGYGARGDDTRHRFDRFGGEDIKLGAWSILREAAVEYASMGFENGLV